MILLRFIEASIAESPKKIEQAQENISKLRVRTVGEFLVSTPQNTGVTKAVAANYFKNGGYFNSELYDKVMNAKLNMEL